MKKNFQRTCPNCNKILYHTRRDVCKLAQDQNLSCQSCSHIGNISPHVGMAHTKEAKQKISDAGRGRPNPHKGVPRSSEARKKIRLAAIRRIEKNHGIFIPNYNPAACKLIEEYGKQYGYNFQHAENGGEFHIKELGYWIDGYDKEKNVVIEVYEPYHIRQVEKDKRRQQEIEEHLECEFIVIEHGINYEKHLAKFQQIS